MGALKEGRGGILPPLFPPLTLQTAAPASPVELSPCRSKLSKSIRLSLLLGSQRSPRLWPPRALPRTGKEAGTAQRETRDSLTGFPPETTKPSTPNLPEDQAWYRPTGRWRLATVRPKGCNRRHPG